MKNSHAPSKKKKKKNHKFTLQVLTTSQQSILYHVNNFASLSYLLYSNMREMKRWQSNFTNRTKQSETASRSSQGDHRTTLTWEIFIYIYIYNNLKFLHLPILWTKVVTTLKFFSSFLFSSSSFFVLHFLCKSF